MDDFQKYEALRDAGATPDEVYSAGKADLLDEITLIRLLRKLFDLSLADAKRTAVGDDWSKIKVQIQVGSKVHWDGWDGPEGPYLMEGRVASIAGLEALVEDLKKYKWIDGEFVQCPYDGPDSRRLKLSYLERPLVERLQEAAVFLGELSEINGR